MRRRRRLSWRRSGSARRTSIAATNWAPHSLPDWLAASSDEGRDRAAVGWGPTTGATMSTIFGAGFHVAPGRAVDASAYERFTGRWSRLFVSSVLGAAEVATGCRVLDVSTGT